MRTAVVVCLAAALAGCGTARAVGRGAGEVKDGFGDAVTAPLDDFNIRRDEIPEVLVRASQNPYELRNMNRCETIAAEVGALDAALGPDKDEPPAPKGTRVERGADAAADATLGAVRDTASDVVPLRSWVRRLSGAARYDKRVQEAIRSGSIRRGYLKGVGMNMNCAPPAAPSWFQPAPPPPPPARTARQSPPRKRN